MALDYWISTAGLVNLKEAREKAAAFLKTDSESLYVAFHTDHFASGRAKTLENEWKETLLELRVFSSDAELHLFRSCISRDFQLRIADDRILKENLAKLECEDFFLKDINHHRMVTRQVLDLNPEDPTFRAGAIDGNGSRLLCTLGGGHYALPMEENDRVAVVIHYLRYDESTGICKVADERLAGFEPLKGGETK